MPQDISKENVNVGEIVYQWAVKEYEEHVRESRWYWVMGVIGIALVVFAVFTANYLFALVIVLFGIILYMHDMMPAQEVPFAITTTGIIIGRKYYRYSELKNFWIVYNPPEVKNLYLGLNNLIKHRLVVPLLDYDPRPIREYLAQYVIEDLEQEEEPLSDRISRLFKF